MRAFLNKYSQWLLPAVLILFISEVATFPFVLGFTWAGRSETPESVLTYTQGKLTWDSDCTINPDGTAELSLFDSVYRNVDSDDGGKVIAPGTEGDSIVRLKNNVAGEIKYTAVLYRIRSIDTLPVNTVLSGDGFNDTDAYTLPDGVAGSDVIRAVSGTVEDGKIQDFDIGWHWQFYDNEAQDIIDTWLGNMAADGKAEDVTVGLYIVVEDDNAYVIPDPPPKAGDVGVGAYIALMCISGFLLILLIINKRRNRRCAD